MANRVAVVTIYRVQCGTCGFWVSAMTDDKKKALMFDHLVEVHGQARLQLPAEVSDTGTT